MRLPKPNEQAVCCACGQQGKIGENGEDICYCGGRLALTISISLDLKDNQAWALAELVKRIGFTDLRSLAASDAEAYEMAEAIGQVHKALAAEGIDPR